jgi:hypothetical protein
MGTDSLWSVRRPFKIAFAVAVGVGVIVGGIYGIRKTFRTEESIEEAARNCLAAVERGDTRRVMSYFREEEIALLDLDYKKLDSLLNGFVLSRLKGFKPEGDCQVTVGTMTTLIIQTYVHPDGRAAGFVLNFVETSDGPKLWHGVLQIASAGIGTYPDPEEEIRKKLAPAWEEAGTFAYRLTKALPDLEALPLQKVAIPEGEERITLKALTWREFAREEQQRWERMAKQKWPFF